MTKSAEVRSLKPMDAAEIAALHYLVFKNFFLTSFGKSFLRLFYKAILSHELGIGVGIFVGNDLAGFAIGSRNNTGFYKSLIYRNGLSLGLAALSNLILSPKKIKRLLKSFSTTANKKYSDLPVLLSICVSPDHGTKGFGRQLLNGFEAILIQSRSEAVLLTTDSHDNDYVNKFYTDNKYRCVQSFLQGKREMNLYYKKLVDETPFL